MRTIRLVGSGAVACLLLGAVISGPATAAERPETYLGNAAARALNLSIGTSRATLGASSAKVDSTLKAVADSAGVLGLPVVGGSNAGVAEVTGDNASKATGEKCATPAIPAPLNTVFTFGAACSSSLAEVKDGNPRAVATGTVAKLDLTAQTILSTPIGAVQPVLAPVLGTIDTINKTLGTDLKVDDTVSEVLKALAATKTLEVKLGNSVSDVSTVADTVTSVATAQGGVISILPIGAAGLKPVAEIEIGSSKATAVYNRGTGESKPSFDASIITIRLNTPTTDALGKIVGQTLNEIKIGPQLNLGSLPVTPLAAPCSDAKNEFCVLPGTPFETRIAVASGRTVTNPDGSVGAVADAVKIHALRGIGTLVPIPQLAGGILLELGHAEAGVAGVPAESTPELVRELPRTGGIPWMPMVGAAVLGAALVTRRTLVRSH